MQAESLQLLPNICIKYHHLHVAYHWFFRDLGDMCWQELNRCNHEIICMEMLHSYIPNHETGPMMSLHGRQHRAGGDGVWVPSHERGDVRHRIDLDGVVAMP